MFFAKNLDLIYNAHAVTKAPQSRFNGLLDTLLLLLLLLLLLP